MFVPTKKKTSTSSSRGQYPPPTSMYRLACWFLCTVLVVTFMYAMSDYETIRSRIIKYERQHALGGNVDLSPAETRLNEKLLRVKLRELTNEDSKPWTKNFIDVVEEIRTNSEVFKFIRKLPKGASLHTHLYASASAEYVINNLLERDNLYVCNVDGRVKLKFLPDNSTEPDCELVADKLNDVDFQNYLKRYLVLSSSDANVWDTFKKIFTFSYDLISYAGVFEDYVYQALLEHYTDNVMYMEVRNPFVPLYDLNGTAYEPEDFIDALWRTVERFKRDHPDFVGLKLIYAQYRGSSVETVRKNFDILRRVMEKYPNFVIGIDFVGFEEEGLLSDYLQELKDIKPIKFYFHAGETNRHGATVDLNILDAILLDSKRIGHAYALPKHPELMKMVRERSIAIEVCPISNQVLGLVSDLRNHPATYLIARDYPVVICSDDPGNWNAQGLSYDWYLAFMAMTSQNAGLGFLKKLAMNSLEHSGFNVEEKAAAFEMWKVKWDRFVKDMNAAEHF